MTGHVFSRASFRAVDGAGFTPAPLSGADRRNATTRRALAYRVSREFEEMPGLCLTLAQAQRLFALQPDVCVRVLDALTGEGTLVRIGDGRYVSGRMTEPRRQQ